MKKYDITLYQYEVCPYCCKVKAYLDYKRLPYKKIEVNPINKKELSFTDYKKVPTIIINGEEINDSNTIIERLEELTGKISDNTENEKKWRNWLDNDFVHLLKLNTSSTLSESLQNFDYITRVNSFLPLQRHILKIERAIKMSSYVKKYIKENNIDNPRAILYEKINYWLDNLTNTFMGVTRPNIADLTLFGHLKSIDNTKAFYDLRVNTNIDKWYLPMSEFVTNSCISK